MGEFKILFYIAIAIGWFILKNYNKVKQNRPVINKKIDEPKVSGNVIKEKVQGNFASEKIKEKIRQSREAIKKEYSDFSKKMEFEVPEKRKKKLASQTPFLTVDMPKEHHEILGTMKDNEYETSEKNKKNMEEDVFLIKNFDIRSAIIYSEILKRPEY